MHGLSEIVAMNKKATRNSNTALKRTEALLKRSLAILELQSQGGLAERMFNEMYLKLIQDIKHAS